MVNDYAIEMHEDSIRDRFNAKYAGGPTHKDCRFTRLDYVAAVGNITSLHGVRGINAAFRYLQALAPPYKAKSNVEIIKMICDPEGKNEFFQKDYEDYKQYEELKEKIMASETEEDFVENVKRFVEAFKDGTFLPMKGIVHGGDKVALWTNRGADGLIGEQGNVKGYRDYMDDQRCVLFRELWGMTQKFIATTETAFAKKLKEDCKKSKTETGLEHIPYDMILSEIYAEYIGKEKLKDVRIEYGQNRDNIPYSGEKMKTQHVFFQSELPVYLARSAKHNVDPKVPKENRVKIEEALARRVEKSDDVKEKLQNAKPPDQKSPVVPLEHEGQKLTVDFKKDLLKPMEGVTFQLEHNEKLKGVRDELIKKSKEKKSEGKEKEKSGDGKMGKSTKEYTDEELNKSKRDFEERKKDRKAMTFPKPDRAIDIDELRSSELHSGIMVDILKGRAKDSTGGKPEGG
ncbi:MAG: hypothetical protein LBU15_00735, partial [Rickettsiales bacterium]|nr:hypothetical protein [Rickettsiales bacterium]